MEQERPSRQMPACVEGLSRDGSYLVSFDDAHTGSWDTGKRSSFFCGSDACHEVLHGLFHQASALILGYEAPVPQHVSQSGIVLRGRCSWV